MASLLWKFLINEKGTSAIEFGLLAVGIAVAFVATIAALGGDPTTASSPVSNSAQ